MFNRALSLLLICFLAACGKDVSEPVAAADAPTATAVSTERFIKDVKVLSSDEFGGRAPASPGEQMTVDYLIKHFKAAGLVGGVDGEFVQPVPLAITNITKISPMRIAAKSGNFELQPVTDAVMWTRRIVESVALSDSEIVFVGYGVVAPEYDWDDYAGLDVSGKTVMMLVNDPGFATGNEALFNGNAMTYYGRWTYKFDEAARQGAAGVILVHEDAAAGYPWAVVSGGWTGEQYYLKSADKNMSKAVMESWVTSAAAEKILSASGHSLAKLKAAAITPAFKAVPTGLKVSVSMSNSIRESNTRNVVAMLPGTTRADETVAFSAHWDHLGNSGSGEDKIFNGAVDNATGTAGLLEMARVLAADPQAERSYLFIALAAEESGLLGSAWFAQHPTVALERMVGLINIDSMNTMGPTRDVTVVGLGSSEMEDYLARAAAEQDRVLERESTPEKGFFYRSDHFNFAKYGVPVLYAEGGVDHLEHGREYGMAADARYITDNYHKPSDEYNSDWDLRGIEQDLQLYLSVARALAHGNDWPQWFEGNEFRAQRMLSEEQRQQAN